MQVGAVDDVTQHVLAPLGHFVGDGVGWDMSLGFGLMVVLLVQSLSRKNARHLPPLSGIAGNWMIKSYV